MPKTRSGSVAAGATISVSLGGFARSIEIVKRTADGELWIEVDADEGDVTAITPEGDDLQMLPEGIGSVTVTTSRAVGGSHLKLHADGTAAIAYHIRALTD